MFNRVRKARNNKGMTQFELSKKSNITQADLSQIENGRIFPYPGWRERIAIALNEEEIYLFPEIAKEVD